MRILTTLVSPLDTSCWAVLCRWWHRPIRTQHVQFVKRREVRPWTAAGLDRMSPRYVTLSLVRLGPTIEPVLFFYLSR